MLPTSVLKTTSLLPADDEAYLETAATAAADLQAIAPRVPVEVGNRVHDADPTLHEDLAAGRDRAVYCCG